MAMIRTPLRGTVLGAAEAFEDFLAPPSEGVPEDAEGVPEVALAPEMRFVTVEP